MTRPRIADRLLAAAVAAGLAVLAGCTEVRGRKMLQDGNELYKQGRYREAVAKFEQAENAVGHLPVLWLNKGYTCRQLIIPGSKTPESRKAADCALNAFKRLQQIAPKDIRGEQLYIQTLLDADEFSALATMFHERQLKAPCDLEVVSTLQQIYAKWDKFDEALEWYKKAAACRPDDAEKHYAVGVFLWQRLFTKGGGAPFGVYDPRPRDMENKSRAGLRRPSAPTAPQPPPNAYGDIVAQQRVDLADLGIRYLEKAVQVRPKYQEAMTYVNLLYRQKSFAYFDDIPKWQECVDTATVWMNKSLELLRAAAGAPAPTTTASTPAPPGGAPTAKAPVAASPPSAPRGP